MSAEIYPGILTHNLEEYKTRLEMVETSASTWAHIDFADGQFVPNITVMPHEMMSISTKLNQEAHLMTYRPERYFSDLTVAGVSRVLLHREVYDDLEACNQALKQASDYFPEVGLVLNLETEIEDYSELPISVIQCMSIHPGMSGQTLLEEVYARITRLKQENPDTMISVDGGISEDNIKQLQAQGAGRFVINSHLFVTNSVAQNFQYFIKLVTGGV